MPERIVGNWRLFEQLGSGTFGVVHRAEHRFLGRPAAVKLLRPERTTDEREVSRFINEARGGLAIEHPNVVKIYDAGRLADGTVYLVMELLHGQSLADHLKRLSRLPEQEALAIAADIAEGLNAAHARGIIHRDVKPANVILIEDGGVQHAKVVDFGVAKLAPHLLPSGGGVATGGIPGSPAYMSPEQSIGAGNIDGRSDLYSLGCVLFEMISGRLPFPHGDPLAMLEAHRSDPPPSLRSLVPDVSPTGEAVIARLLAKKPRDRYQSGRDVVKVLAPNRPEERVPAPARAAGSRWTIAAAIAAFVIGAVGLALLLWGLDAMQADHADSLIGVIRWQDSTGERIYGDICVEAKKRLADPTSPHWWTLAEIDYACRRGFSHARTATVGSALLGTGTLALLFLVLRGWILRRRTMRPRPAAPGAPAPNPLVESTLPSPAGKDQPAAARPQDQPPAAS